METIIPEDILIDKIKSANKGELIYDCICPHCKKQINEVKFYPYTWDQDNAEVTYAGICPCCDKILYMQD